MLENKKNKKSKIQKLNSNSLQSLLSSVYNLKINIEPEYLEVLDVNDMEKYLNVIDKIDYFKKVLSSVKRIVKKEEKEIEKEIEKTMETYDDDINDINIDIISNDKHIINNINIDIRGDDKKIIEKTIRDFLQNVSINTHEFEELNNLTVSEMIDAILEDIEIHNKQSHIFQRFQQILKENITMNFSQHLLTSFIETIKASFFNPNCKTFGNVLVNIGIDVEQKEIEELMVEDFFNYLNRLSPNYYKYRKHRYIEEDEEDESYIKDVIQPMRDICEKYCKINQINIEKVKSSNNFNDKNIASIILLLSIKAKHVLELLNKTEQLLNGQLTFNKLVDLFKITKNLRHEMYLFQNLATQYALSCKESDNNNANNFIDEIIRKHTLIFGTGENDGNKLVKNCFNILNGFLDKISVSFDTYKNFVEKKLKNSGYDIGKFYPPVDYIKQHFGDDKNVIKNMIDQYIQQTTVFLKSIVPTFKYPINLLTFNNLLKYQELMNDNSILTPERINQLRSQIVQTIDFMTINNLPMDEPVLQEELEKIINNNEIGNLLNNNIDISNIVKMINVIVNIYNKEIKSKIRKEIPDKPQTKTEFYSQDTIVKISDSIVLDLNNKEKNVYGLTEMDRIYNLIEPGKEFNYSYNVMLLSKIDLVLGIPEDVVKLYLEIYRTIYYDTATDHLSSLNSKFIADCFLINDFTAIKYGYFNGLNKDEIWLATIIKNTMICNEVISPFLNNMLQNIIDVFLILKRNGVDIIKDQKDIQDFYYQHLDLESETYLTEEQFKEISNKLITKYKVKNVFKNLQTREETKNNITTKIFKI